MSNGLAAADLTQARPRSAEASAAVGARLPSGLLGWWWALWLISNGLDRASMNAPGPATELNLEDAEQVQCD